MAGDLIAGAAGRQQQEKTQQTYPRMAGWRHGASVSPNFARMAVAIVVLQSPC